MTESIETQELMNNIAASSGIMNKIADYEDELEGLEKHLDSDKKWGGIPALLLFLLLGFIIPVLGHIILIGIWVFIHNRLTKATANIERVNKEMAKLQNDPVLYWLPETYRNPFDFGLIAGYVGNKRADTLREAINLLETEKHQQRLELFTLMGKNSAQ